MAKQRGKHRLGNFLFVVRNRQPAFHDVKHSLGGAAIAPWIVQHPLLYSVRVNVLGCVRVLVGRERQGARQTVMLQLKGVGGNLWDFATAIGQGAIEKILYPRIDRAMVLRQQAILLLQIGQKVLAGLEKGKLTLLANDRLAAKPQLGIDHLAQAPPVLIGVQVHAEAKPSLQFLCIIQIHPQKNDYRLARQKVRENQFALPSALPSLSIPCPAYGSLPPMSHEERLVNIESDLTHLEQLVASLNQTIIVHEKTIQQLQVQVNRVATGLESKEMDSIKGNVTKPPHYQ